MNEHPSISAGPIERLYARHDSTNVAPLVCFGLIFGVLCWSILMAWNLATSVSLLRTAPGVFLVPVVAAMAMATARSWRNRPVSESAATVALTCSEGALLVGAAVAARDDQVGAGPLALGFIAFAGVLLITYAHVRVLASAKLDLPDGPLGVASRDVRLLAFAALIALGQPYVALMVVAALTHGAVLLHLLRLRLSLSD